MTENEFQPEVRFVIEDLETLRVMADPLRGQIYEILLNKPANVRQVAEQLGLAPSRLYYHFNMLEKCGLLRVVETRMVSNIQEKLYRSAAYELEIAPGLLDFRTEQGKQSIADLSVNTLDVTRDDLVRSLQARAYLLEQGAVEKPRSIIITRLLASIPDEQADEFHSRLKALLKEFSDADKTGQPGAPEQQFALTIAFYPSFYYTSEDASE